MSATIFRGSVDLWASEDDDEAAVEEFPTLAEAKAWAAAILARLAKVGAVSGASIERGRWVHHPHGPPREWEPDEDWWCVGYVLTDGGVEWDQP